MRGRKNTVKVCETLNEQGALKASEVLKAQEGAAIPEGVKAQKKIKTLGVRKTQSTEKTPTEHRHKTRKSSRNKKYTLAAMVRAAADPKKRAVMSRVWHRRQKRLDHIAAAVRLAIRYLNARDRTTIDRNH